MAETTEQKSKKCVYCGHYTGYYIRGLHRFERTKQGFCSQCNNIVCNNDTCECWTTSSHRFYIRKRAIARALNKILIDLSAIRQIIQEQQEEKENL